MIAQIKTDHGRQFTMRLVLRGDTYGRDNCLTHERDEPLVEFYDQTFAGQAAGHVLPDGFEPGQFVNRYYMTTLQENEYDNGLTLDGGIPVWTLDRAAFRTCREILRNWNQ